MEELRMDDLKLVQGSPPNFAYPAATNETNGMRSRCPMSLHAWPQHLAGQPNRPIEVIAAGDISYLRCSIIPQLMSDPRTLLVGQATSVRAARALIRTKSFAVALISQEMPDGDGLALVKDAICSQPECAVIVLGTEEQCDDVLRAFGLGAVGFLVTDSWFDDLVGAVLQVANGGACLSPILIKRLLTLHRVRRADPEVPDSSFDLSERERTILELVAMGLTTSKIAGRLNIAKPIVDTHLKHVAHKLQSRTRAQAVARAASLGILGIWNRA
jgi:DNA-binding NarL/FixJ family response regulator